MTALWVEQAPRLEPLDPTEADRSLRLVEVEGRSGLDGIGRLPGCEPWSTDPGVVPQRHGGQLRRRRASLVVRRRRTLLAVMGLLLVGLALPLSGTGGSSHATGSAPVETAGSSVYTVRAGDTLWSIAERVDPSGDPRPLVAQLTKEIGSDTVVPGERITVP
jgi:hypothetical protein